MGWNHSLICLTCDSIKEVDLETDSEELKNWMIKHWGHKAKIEWYEDGKLLSQDLHQFKKRVTGKYGRHRPKY